MTIQVCGRMGQVMGRGSRAGGEKAFQENTGKRGCD